MLLRSSSQSNSEQTATQTQKLWNCSCEISLVDNPSGEINTPFHFISGLFHFNCDLADSGVTCALRSVRIQVEGHAISHFHSKEVNRLKKKTQDTIFLPDKNDASVNRNLSVYVIGNEISPWDNCTKFTRGVHTFPFKIELSLSGQQVPPTFQTEFGRIQYKLVAYVAQGVRDEIPACEKILKVKGYLDLNLLPELDRPLVVTKEKKEKSFLSSFGLSFSPTRPLLKIDIFLQKRGYIPREYLNFLVVLENPQSELVTLVQVTFVQKIIYYINKVSKSTRAVLGEQEFWCNTCDAEIQWDTGFVLPASLMPTFTNENPNRDKSIEITYSIEFMATTEGPSVELKGETEIVIGSSRGEESEPDRGAGASTSSAEVRACEGSKNDSVETTLPLPPGYATLFSRTTSVETLPPTYSEATAPTWDEINEDFRPRCSSNAI